MMPAKVFRMMTLAGAVAMGFFLAAASVQADDAPHSAGDHPASADHGHDHAAGHDHDDHGAGHDHDDHGAGHDQNDHGGHHEKTIHGEPAKNYFGPKTEFLYVSPQLFLWTLIVFLPLWYVLQRLVWKPMIQALEDRDSRIADTLTQAIKLREEARSLTVGLDPETIRTQQEVRTVLDQARSEAAHEVSEMITAAREETAAAQKSARQAIESAAGEAMAKIESSASHVGETIASALTRTGGPR
jgi:F-type H+-transporting ATPase subunit b